MLQTNPGSRKRVFMSILHWKLFLYLTLGLYLYQNRGWIFLSENLFPIIVHMSLQAGILTLLDKNTDVPLHANSCEPKIIFGRQVWMIKEDQAFLQSYDSVPRPPTPPPFPVSKLPLCLSLPVCWRPNLRTGEGEGWAWSRIIRPELGDPVFLGLLDPDPLVRGTNPYPAPDASLFS